jgi:uncharacterized membrane protein YeaQ/YmgE (transglycosylase-associated protein family)
MRSLLSHSALLAPLFPLAYAGDLVSVLAYLILVQALASLLSSYVWGALSDKRALLCMQLGAVLALLASLGLLCLLVFYPSFLHNITWVLSLFFILSIGHSGVRTGRKVDIASGHERTEFVALSNSVVGSFILLTGFLYSLLMVFDINLALSFMTVGLVAGLVTSQFVKKEK